MGRIRVSPNKAAVIKKHGFLYWGYRALPIINTLGIAAILLKLFEVI